MKRFKHSLSNYKLLTCDMGYLVPLNWIEVLPGDTIQQQTSALIRVSPLLSPVMHPVRVRIHHWFVPNRLIWEDWETFITGGQSGDETPNHPYILFNGESPHGESSLADYIGVPPLGGMQQQMINALPFRAYNLIFNEMYRDQDLVDERELDIGSGADSVTDISLASVAWEKDKFTSCRPWPQRGTEVTIPFSGTAPVEGIARQSGQTNWPYNDSGYESGQVTPTSYASNIRVGDGAEDQELIIERMGTTNYPNIRVDLANSSANIDIDELRLAFALQRYREARARYGARYVEYLRYLGIKSSDSRLSLPEYLGGGRQVIQFSEVLSHGDATMGESTLPLGSMAGHGISGQRTNRFRRFFEEHGIVMTLMSVVPKAIYMQGLETSLNGIQRQTKEDYYQRELENIGDVEVPHSEVFVQSTESEAFGYQQRYDEYRYKPSSVAGEFRSTMNHWHLARDFEGDPGLNSSFVSCVPTKRVLASQETDALYVMAHHNIKARRLVGR